MSLSVLATTQIAGSLLGFVFSIFKLPLPVPRLAAYDAVHGFISRANGWLCSTFPSASQWPPLTFWC